MSAPTILVADDDTAIRTVLTQALGRAGYAVRATGNAATLWRWVAEGEGDVVLTDVVLPDENAFELLPRMKRARPNLPILVMSAKNTMMTAITAAERGAYDYLPKPFDLNDLIRLAGRALEDSRRQPAPKRSHAEAEPEELPIVGRSAAMQEIYRVIGRMTQTDLTVKDITLGASPAIAGQSMSITVTVHNGGDFPRDAENVKVKVFSIDEFENQEYIGELDFGTIDPDVDYYPSDAALRKGDKQAKLTWETSTLVDADAVDKFSIKAQVDPDGYVREISETNNEQSTDVEVVGSAKASTSFELTFMMLALGVMVVSGLSVYLKKKRE